jgi:hypothetical protein
MNWEVISGAAGFERTHILDRGLAQLVRRSGSELERTPQVILEPIQLRHLDVWK